MLSEADLEVAR